MDATTSTAAATPVLKPEDARRLRIERFLARIQTAKSTAERHGFRLRIAPQVYDPAKNVYVTWPERAWSIEIQTLEDAEAVFARIDHALASGPTT